MTLDVGFIYNLQDSVIDFKINLTPMEGHTNSPMNLICNVTSRAYDLILYFCVTIPNYHQIRRVQTGGAGRIHWGKPLYLWSYVNQSWTAFTRLHRTYTELRETTFPPWTANGYTGHLKRAPILGMDQL